MWSRVRGHEALIQAFEQVVKSGRLAHAYLFVGPAGVGKRAFANELAKALLCEARPDGRLEACDRCPSCLQILAGTHPDFFTASRPEELNEFPIKLMQDLCQSFALKSARGRGKVAIVDDADDLNEEAANCFLKTLEEPPPGSVLILIGTSAQQQLPTIVSRCQVVVFAPLPSNVVDELLREKGIEDAALRQRLLRRSSGSPGLALALADPAIWEFRQALIQKLAAPKLDTIALAQEWMQFLEDAGKEAAAQRRRARVVLRLLIEFLQAGLATSVKAQPTSLEPEDQAPLKSLASRVDPDQILAMLDRCFEAERQMERYVQLVLVVEALLDNLGQQLRAR